VANSKIVLFICIYIRNELLYNPCIIKRACLYLVL
jgi:hypothetical protein